MKKSFLWILGAVEIVVGAALFLYAEDVLQNNFWYALTQPQKYELMRTVGIVLMVWGAINIALKLFQTKFTGNHLQDKTALSNANAAINCPKCGLSIAGNLEVCPRCGEPIVTVHQQSAPKYCPECGSALNPSIPFCPNCNKKYR